MLLEELINKTKGNKFVNLNVFAAWAAECQEAKNAKEQYHLNDLDLKYHITHDMPFAAHACRICGKTVHIVPGQLGQGFKKYCSVACATKDKEKYRKAALSRQATVNTAEFKAKLIQSNLKRYGVEYYVQSEEFKNKARQTSLSKYGVSNPAMLDQIKEKTIKTNLERYGSKCALGNAEIKAKAIKTNLEKYGVENAAKAAEVKEKVIKTNLERYGCEWAAKNENVKAKIRASALKRYGVTCTLNHPDVKSRAEASMLNRHGVSSPLKSAGILAKFRQTKFGNTYEYIASLAENSDVHPAFSADEFVGGGYDKLYAWKCSKCGKQFQAYYANGSLPVCRGCHPKKFGAMQKELEDYIRGIYRGEVLVNDRTVISPMELDIYLPDLKLAFEFNGTFWHSDGLKGKDYHVFKTELCHRHGIHLIHIWEHEWKFKQPQIKHRLDYILGNSKPVYARKCSATPISAADANKFCREYHLQGECKAKLHYGLYCQGELVAVMTFGKPRFNGRYQWELLRYCSRERVIGGAGKLLKLFEREIKPESLITYANRSWSDGNMYARLGFEFNGVSAPNYVYAKGETIIPRYKAQKHKLKVLLGAELYDESKTETENMLGSGYLKLYDCGNLCFAKSYK